jgi:hypothetical protein
VPSPAALLHWLGEGAAHLPGGAGPAGAAAAALIGAALLALLLGVSAPPVPSGDETATGIDASASVQPASVCAGSAVATPAIHRRGIAAAEAAAR